ncbi:MAG: hypothetical protein R2764_08925 [Bacteroidales bacterium]
MKKTILLSSIILICIFHSCKMPELVCDEKYIPEYKSISSKVTVSPGDLPDVNGKFYSARWITDNQIAYVKYSDELFPFIADISPTKKSNYESSPDVIFFSLDNGKTLDINSEHQSIIRETYDELFHVEPVKESVGTSMLKVFSSLSFDYIGWISDIQSSNKIKFELHVYGDKSNKTITKLTLENEEMGYKSLFAEESYDKIRYTTGSRSVLSISSMQVSPDGRFVKLGNNILDIKTGEKIMLHNINESILSNDWRKIVFFSRNSEVKGAIDITTTKFVMQ